MDDLVAFLSARLDEDEAAAKAATPGPWEFEGDDPTDDEVFDVADCRPVAFTRGGGRQVANGQHIARHDPARVLREVEAKRAILALHDGTHGCPIATWVHHPEKGKWLYVSSEHVAEGDLPPYWPCTTLRHLAAVWDGHPDYRQEWKP